jgi:hypothetical protein
MAVSLVSTGVQFPDATIQTTAATAAPVPGATAQYSIVGRSQIGGSSTTAFTISGLASGLVYNNNFNGTAQSGGSGRSFSSIFWSSYYSCWVALGNSSSTALIGIFVSKDGLSWRCILENLSTVVGGAPISLQGESGMPSIAVDDSNGRFFVMVFNGSDIIIRYSPIVATTPLNANWSVASTLTGDRVGGLMYCKMATTGASGIVAVYNNSNNGDFFIRTISAGATTSTARLTVNISSGSTGWGIYQENGFIAVPIANGARVAYNLSGDITAGWTSNTSLPASVTDNVQSAVGNGYMVYINSSNIYWSTNGTSWTLQSIDGTAKQGITYTGSAWLTWDSANMYISSTAAPNSTWSLYNGGVNGTRNALLGIAWGRRVTAA